MEKRGALHPAMDPFKMEANRGLNQAYSLDMCPRTLDCLRRTVYLNIGPDRTESDLENLVKKIT